MFRSAQHDNDIRVGRTQTTDFDPFVLSFLRPAERINDQQKKKNTLNGDYVSAVETQATADMRVRAWPVRRRGVLILALVVLALALLGFKTWRVYDRTQLVRQDVAAIQALARAPRDLALVDTLGAQLTKTRSDVAALRAEAGMFLPITRYLGWVPVYGGDLAAAKPLLDAAVDLSAAADDAFAAFGPLLATAAGTPSSAQIYSRIVAAGPQIDRANAALDRGAAAWSQVDLTTLSPALHDQLTPVAQMLPLARLGLALAPLLPDVLDDLQLLAPYAHGAPDTTKLAALGPLLKKTRADVATLHAAATPRLQALALAAGKNNTPQLDARPLLDAAADLTLAADEAYAALAPVMLQRDGTQPIGVAMTTQLVAARPQLDLARQAAARAADVWAHVDLDAMPVALATQLRSIGGLVATLRDGLELAQALPNLLGANAPAEYLLLAQNPDELRATGGFIGAVGGLTFDQGRPGEITMEYSPKVDDISNQVYPDPPQPLLRYMNIEMLLFRDANWSPDFPTAAKTARDLYKLGRGRDIANVVAFDPYAAQDLLTAIGPVTVEGAPAPITAANVFDYLRSEHDAQGGAPDPKAYIGSLANAMLAKLQSNTANLDLWALALAFRRALSERHLLVAVQDAVAAPIFSRHGWDGAVQPGAADFLMVVDTNMGYNKVNARITESISYTVDLSDPSAPVATAIIRHTHSSMIKSRVCSSMPRPRPRAMPDGCSAATTIIARAGAARQPADRFDHAAGAGCLDGFAGGR